MANKGIYNNQQRVNRLLLCEVVCILSSRYSSVWLVVR